MFGVVLSMLCGFAGGFILYKGMKESLSNLIAIGMLLILVGIMVICSI